jgi:ornithine carbamoyltransferase
MHTDRGRNIVDGSINKQLQICGGQSILFDPATLEKKENIRDVCGYLQNWADVVIARYREIDLLVQMET